MSIGEIAYNTYCQQRGWKSVRGETLPTYEQQSPELQAAWTEAARAVGNEIVSRMSDEWVTIAHQYFDERNPVPQREAQ